jgi:hypothetical protein
MIHPARIGDKIPTRLLKEHPEWPTHVSAHDTSAPAKAYVCLSCGVYLANEHQLHAHARSMNEEDRHTVAGSDGFSFFPL